MTNRKKWIAVLVVVIGAVVALAAGVSPTTVLLVGVILLCPAVMWFGMSGMQHGSSHAETNKQSENGELDAKEREQSRH